MLIVDHKVLVGLGLHEANKAETNSVDLPDLHWGRRALSQILTQAPMAIGCDVPLTTLPRPDNAV